MIDRAGKPLSPVLSWSHLTIQYSPIHDFPHTVRFTFPHPSRIPKCMVTIQLREISSVTWNRKIHDVKFRNPLMQCISLSISHTSQAFEVYNNVYRRMSHSVMKAVPEQRGRLAHFLLIKLFCKSGITRRKDSTPMNYSNMRQQDSPRHERDVLTEYKLYPNARVPKRGTSLICTTPCGVGHMLSFYVYRIAAHFCRCVQTIASDYLSNFLNK